MLLPPGIDRMLHEAGAHQRHLFPARMGHPVRIARLPGDLSCVSDVLHQATMAVDEKGTEDAASNQFATAKPRSRDSLRSKVSITVALLALAESRIPPSEAEDPRTSRFSSGSRRSGDCPVSLLATTARLCLINGHDELDSFAVADAGDRVRLRQAASCVELQHRDAPVCVDGR